MKTLKNKMNRWTIAASLISLVGSTIMIYEIWQYSTNPMLSYVYIAACCLNVFYFYTIRTDPLSPIGIAVIFHTIAFLLPVIFYVIYGNFAETRKVIPDSDQLVYTVTISSLGMMSFFVGSKFTCSWMTRALGQLFKWAVICKRPVRPVCHKEFVFIFFWLLIGCYVQLQFQIGMPGYGSLITIPFISGILRLFFREGGLILCAIFFYRTLSARRIYNFEFFILISIYIITMVLLGWRGAMMGALFLVCITIWYHRKLRNLHSMPILLILLLFCLVPLSINQSNRLRESRDHGLAENYAITPQKFLFRVLSRIDGNRRLSGVLQSEMKEHSINLVNDFKFVQLIKMGLSGNRYADFYIWGIGEGSHYVGASGVGELYIYLGLLGVVVGFFIMGVMIWPLYQIIFTNFEPVLAIAFYATQVSASIRTSFAETSIYNAEACKAYLIIFIVLRLAKLVLMRKNVHYAQIISPNV